MVKKYIFKFKYGKNAWFDLEISSQYDTMSFLESDLLMFKGLTLLLNIFLYFVMVRLRRESQNRNH